MSKLFTELKAGLEEALDHARGRPITGREKTISIERSEVRAARLKAGMTQEQFAVVLGASLDTLRKWEQGARAYRTRAYSTNAKSASSRGPRAPASRLTSRHCAGLIGGKCASPSGARSTSVI